MGLKIAYDNDQPLGFSFIRNDQTDLGEGGEQGMLHRLWKMTLYEDSIGFERDERGQG